MVKVDTFPVKPVDTTGAGDAFYSYFLASLVNHPDFINDDEQINTTMKFIGTKMVPGFGGYKGNETLAFVFEREDNKKIVLTNYSSCKYNDFTSFFAIYGDCSDGMRYIFLK